jgi:hypothetical protein
LKGVQHGRLVMTVAQPESGHDHSATKPHTHRQ